MKRHRKLSRGSLLLEAVLALPLLVGVSLINIEVVRRARQEVLLEQSAFLFVRARALGASSERALGLVSQFVSLALGSDSAKRYLKQLRIEEAILAGKWRVKFHQRYRTLLNFPVWDQTKHHYEVTRACHFPFSY